MSNKMLIDASHPEETRVAVVRGNRIEEFDFESQEKKQLRGNIYLAKVTRVEPSLQAAFIDYGGNRHGFLAFSEIHPDYYQIPVADRQALLEAEAAEARAAREEDDAAGDDDAVEASDDEAQEAPKKKPRRRRSRKAKSADSESGDRELGDSEQPESEAADADEAPVASEEAAALSDDATTQDANSEPVASEEAAEEKPKPKRRSTRRKPAAKKAAAETSDDAPSETADAGDTTEPSDEGSEDGSDDGSPQTMAAMIEMDEISEPLPDDDDRSGDAEEDASDDEPVAEEKPKRRRTSRPRRKTKAEIAAEEDAATSEQPVEAEAVAEDTSAKDSTDETASTTEDASEPVEAKEEAEEEATEKPKRQSRRRSSRKKEEPKEAPDETDTDDDTDASPDVDVESVGQEDAMEEVPMPRRQRRHYKIQEVVKRRQVLLVQVVKEERGTKGAALTTYLSLAGRYSVLMPNTARGGGISRKITNSSDRKRLKAIASELEVPAGMGVILRTAGAARTKDEINRDFEYLMRLWEKVRNLTLSSSAPCLVYEEGSLIKRSIRDLYDKDTGEVIVTGDEGFKEAKDFMTMLMPSHANKVKQYTGSQAIFAKYGVESHLDKMISPEVTLKSGGYLVINQTEALVAVDVNSGRSTREHSVEDTALQTNLEAAEEVARQLRLRDLAGLIVIDFIDMEERRNNRAVEKRLKDCLKNDRARIQVGRISHFGLMEMSRQRMRASVLESTMDVCPHCAGTGYIRSDSAIALHVFRAIEEHVARHNRFDCLVKTSPSIAIHILNHKRAALMELESRYGLQVLIEADSDIAGQEFKIEKGDPASGEAAPAPIGYQDDAAPDDVDGASDENEDGGRKKRGRGRRRKNQDGEAGSEQSASENASDTVDAETSDNDEDQPRKKRRRGKRGGRKSKPATGEMDETSSSSDAETAQGETTETGATAIAAETEPAAEAQAAAAAETAEADTEAAKPKSRSTRRRKAPVAPKPEPQEEAVVEAASGEAEESDDAPVAEAKKPARRRTTRRAAPKAEETSSDDGEAPASTESTDTGPEEGTSEEDSSAKETGEKKKSGWWGRGGGFF